MFLPAALTVTTSVPFFASYLAEGDKSRSDDFAIILYVCCVGFIVSLAAIMDDGADLTSWFGLGVGSLT